MAKKIIDLSGKSLSPDELKILARVVRDPIFFSTFCFVINPIHGKVPFDLYPFQKSTLFQFLLNRFNIILKGRQMGVTELIAMFCLWLAMYHENKKINIISIKDTVAKKVLKKIKFMYKNLPWYLQVPITNGRAGEYGNQTDMEFINGSFISSIPTTEQAGRSESLTLLVIDETAAVRWASTIWASAAPTLSTGGAAILNSTPLGIGGFYHSTWSDAINGTNGFNPIRLNWWLHPERDMNWYNKMSSMLGPKRTAQEIDGDFLSSGNTVFELTDIKAIEQMLSEYPAIKTRFNGQLKEFNEVEKDTSYFIGADISTGRNTDSSAFSVQKADGEETACFKGKIPINRFGKLLGDTGRKWNYAKLAPETNDVGVAVTSYLQDEGYPNLYYFSKLIKKKGKRKPEVEKYPGWLTTTKNRSVIIEGLESDVREDNVIIKNPFFVNEAYTFIYDGMGRPIAMGKGNRNTSSVDIDLEGETYSDDAIFAEAITNHIRKTSKNIVTTTPK